MSDIDMNDVEERALALLEDVCADEAGLLDSMGAIELLVGIETEFGVSIAPTEVEREEMNSVNKIIHQIEVRL